MWRVRARYMQRAFYHEQPAMLDLRVVFDIRSAVVGLEEYAKQVPYATALAINEVAFLARKDLADLLPETFAVRNAWTAKGMRVDTATKRTLTAEVGSTRPYMGPHALGGERAGTKKGAVPKVGPGLARPTEQAITRPSRYPKKLIGKGGKRGYFIATMPGGVKGVFRRKGKDRLPIEAAYLFLRRRAKIRKNWPLLTRVGRAVAIGWQPAMIRALQKALAGAQAKAARVGVPKGLPKPKKPVRNTPADKASFAQRAANARWARSRGG